MLDLEGVGEWENVARLRRRALHPLRRSLFFVVFSWLDHLLLYRCFHLLLVLCIAASSSALFRIRLCRLLFLFFSLLIFLCEMNCVD
jgi:hypothetical protein